MRDKEVLEEPGQIQPVAGASGQLIPAVDDVPRLEDQFPDEERDAGDEMIVPDDDRLLDSGSSPEFDHSLKRRND
ncbi:MAG: hypothetical protein IT334_11210 [Thermomicrobiales bacterium]|nr:hypothetical protein [Thermomicrobiales bacterium]